MQIRIVCRPGPEYRFLVDGVVHHSTETLPADIRGHVELMLATRNVHEDLDGNGVPDLHEKMFALNKGKGGVLMPPGWQISKQDYSSWDPNFAQPCDVDLFAAPPGPYSGRPVLDVAALLTHQRAALETPKQHGINPWVALGIGILIGFIVFKFM